METLNEALKIAAMDVAVVGASSGKEHNDNEIGEETGKRLLISTSANSNAESKRSGSSTPGARGGGGAKVAGGEVEGGAPSTSGAVAVPATGCIFVFQDGTFQPR